MLREKGKPRFGEPWPGESPHARGRKGLNSPPGMPGPESHESPGARLSWGLCPCQGSGGMSSRLAGSAEPIRNPGPAVGEGPGARGPTSPTPGWLAPPTHRAHSPAPSCWPLFFSSSPRTGHKGPGRGTQWPFSVLPGQPPGVALGERAGVGGRDITPSARAQPPPPRPGTECPRPAHLVAASRRRRLPEARSPSSWVSCRRPGPVLSSSLSDLSESSPQPHPSLLSPCPFHRRGH